MRLAAAVSFVALVQVCPAGRRVETQEPAGRSPSNQSPDDWNITFRVSGGFAGISRVLTVASTGSVDATDQRRGAHVAGRLAPADRVEVETALAQLKSSELRRNAACRDCFQYDIDVRLRDRRMEFHVDSAAVDVTDVNALVKALSVVLSRILASH
jgi:hypothetical protein